MTNWKNKKLLEEGKLPKLPLKSPTPAPPKKYPLEPPSGHDHPYAIAANRIHALEWTNKQLLADNDNLGKQVRELSKENLSLRKLALHGLIYRLDSLINSELAKQYPNPVRVRRWTEERMRFTVAYERIKAGKIVEEAESCDSKE